MTPLSWGQHSLVGVPLQVPAADEIRGFVGASLCRLDAPHNHLPSRAGPWPGPRDSSEESLTVFLGCDGAFSHVPCLVRGQQSAESGLLLDPCLAGAAREDSPQASNDA